MNRKTRYMTDPDGNNHTIENLFEFAVDNDLDPDGMAHVCRESIPHYKGWRNGHDQGPFKKQKKIDDAGIERMRKLSHTCTYDEIAKRFGVTRNTVRNYLCS